MSAVWPRHVSFALTAAPRAINRFISRLRTRRVAPFPFAPVVFDRRRGGQIDTPHCHFARQRQRFTP
jgi:hypothetical protein